MTIVDSTALNTASNPILGVFETAINGMSDDVSLNARLYATTLTYTGLGYVVGKLRDASKNHFDITDKTSERIQRLHDSAYLASINIIISPFLYLGAGETDVKKIAIGTGVNTAFGLFLGPLMGYAVDAYRDLTGLKPCERSSYPSSIRNLKPRAKKGLAVALTAASVGALALVYSLTPNEERTAYKNLMTEQQIVVACREQDHTRKLNKELYSE